MRISLFFMNVHQLRNKFMLMWNKNIFILHVRICQTTWQQHMSQPCCIAFWLNFMHVVQLFGHPPTNNSVCCWLRWFANKRFGFCNTKISPRQQHEFPANTISSYASKSLVVGLVFLPAKNRKKVLLLLIVISKLNFWLK